ncbi:unnamed protein product [[Candida] boidinii]|nr:unnamed protein product [[Candida] boidinii]
MYQVKIHFFNSASSATTKSTAAKKSENEQSEKDAHNDESLIVNDSNHPVIDPASESNVSKTIGKDEASVVATGEATSKTSTEAPEATSEEVPTQDPKEVPRTPALQMFDNVWSTLSGYKK